jgi:hypothetical protein
MWRKVRVSILLLILAIVAQQAILKDGAPNWKRTLYVNVYPINADASIASTQTIASLDSSQLDDLNNYFKEEVVRYGLLLDQPFSFRWGTEIKALPPKLTPGQIPWRNMLNTAIWSLKFRWWAHNHSPQTAMPADIRLYVLYHDPANHEILEHSTALNKGRIGIVNVFASTAYTKQNNIVIAHELAHTVGATDKYDPVSNQPVYPAGFAQPELSSLYPQTFAELMAGRTPMSENQAEIPKSLAFTIIGGVTAKEIGWLKNQ